MGVVNPLFVLVRALGRGDTRFPLVIPTRHGSTGFFSPWWTPTVVGVDAT